jgi:hypothetical protein
MSMVSRYFRIPYVLAPLLIGGTAALALLVARGESQPAPPPVTPITINSTVPVELNVDGGGAPDATLDQAAAFAWQEFIALNWPAKTQTGAVGDRDTPGADCLLGGVPNPNAPTPGTDCPTRPLTWQTMRGKAEIFTNGATQNYDTPPTYADLYAHAIPACAGTVPPAGQAAWINLDETTEITEAAMYAGVAPASSPVNSQPQLIRFMAKANRAEFNYYNAIAPISRQLRSATQAYLQTADPPPGSVQYISLPNNTIELKAGWRMLTDAEQQSGRYHMATVRYYEPASPGSADMCYREGAWGLVALHIIQKTASAPYFIYATFEQADNIQTASGQYPAGQFGVEDENGAVPSLPPCPAGQAPTPGQPPSSPCPTTPSLMFNDTETVNTNQIPPNVTLAQSGAGFCPPTGSRLFYVNLLPALPTNGRICINYRDNLIPATIIAANQRAHAAILAYNQANGIASSPWLYYKLVNVQYRPLNNATPGRYAGPDPETFYLANIMVETNRPLQLFSGGLVQSGLTGSNSEYQSQFVSGATGTHHNSYYRGTGYNMGGCMGCHGSQGQSQGGDFSVILARGTTSTQAPEALPPPLPANALTRPRGRRPAR